MFGKIDIKRESVVANGSQRQRAVSRHAAVGHVAIRTKSKLKCSGGCLSREQKIGSLFALVGDNDDISATTDEREWEVESGIPAEFSASSSQPYAPLEFNS
jgi:hypothetical protein